MNTERMNSLSRFFRALQHSQKLTRKLRTIVETRVLGPTLSPFRRGNIAMFHIGRSGSTVLADLLNQHPKVFWDGEIYERLFRDWEKRGFVLGAHDLPVDPIKLLRERMTRTSKKFYGFEVKFFHLRLTNVRLPDYIEYLHDLGFNYFITLKRKNNLRKIVSSIVAGKKSQYHQPRHEKAVLTRIELDVDNVKIDRDAKPLIAYLQDYHESFRELEKLLNGRRVLRLTYEDDISADPLLGYQRVCDFLGIDHPEVSIRYGKANPFKLTDMVINFGEVERTLRGTPFEWMLYE